MSALLLVLAGCGGGETSVENVARQFVAAINSGNAASAANLTDNPAAARPVIEQMLAGLPADDVRFEVEQASSTGGGSGNVSLRAKWDFGKDRTWEYTTDSTMTQLSIGWRLAWAPDLLVPEFKAGQTVQLIRTDAAPPKVLDANGQPYMAEQTVNQVRIDASQTPDLEDSARRLAAVIVPVAPLVTAQVLIDRASSKSGPVDAVALRGPDFAILEGSIRAIPGVSVEQVPKLVLANPNLASPVTSDIARRWQATRDNTAGWAVTITGPGGVVNQVAGHQGPPPPDLGVNLDSHVQLSAVNGVVGVGQPAALVAFRPSTGQVLAVAQNSQADVEGQVGLQRLEPPGAIFSAFLRAGGVDPTSAEQVQKAARQIGLGVDLPLPGFTATTGKIGDDGQPVASAYGMAVAATTIADGKLPSPALFTGDAGEVTGPTEALPGELRDNYRRLMADSVATGALTVLGAHSGLNALTGQVESDAENPPSWLIGITGDLAFAVFVGATDGTSNAVIVADQFLRALARPPL
ncbi:NTF2-like N-terminal transpeptidase domain-containing protein [Tomitella biformata]|uniref:NTF2-like N-terminal transpeptidase domain-containing protein n=1 Tax=Tomitella biformata TaxID=630403 RepID=UPI0006868BE3|nr:NTF2-like N-terminal transpeptidase domain-containing protein [Tomitella biformata]